MESVFINPFQDVLPKTPTSSLSRIFYLILLAKSICIASTQADFLETVLQWPLLDYALPDRRYVDQFRPENAVPTGFEVSWRRIFIATPRLRAGVPATLSFVPLDHHLGGSPRLQAYPSWDWHGAGIGDLNCSKIISVYRVRKDSCNRLWVLDSGVTTSIDDFQVVCPPKLLVFDLQTDTLARMITFPRQVDKNPISSILGKFRDESSFAVFFHDRKHRRYARFYRRTVAPSRAPQRAPRCVARANSPVSPAFVEMGKKFKDTFVVEFRQEQCPMGKKFFFPGSAARFLADEPRHRRNHGDLVR